MTAPVRPELCNRLRGRSVRRCVCRLPHELGWLDCPPDAQGLLEPVEPGPPDLPSRAETIVAPYIMPGKTAAFSLPSARVRLSGDICDYCGSPNLQWAGTCKLCRDCGSSAGGCS
jgi:hypothetical protein